MFIRPSMPIVVVFTIKIDNNLANPNGLSTLGTSFVGQTICYESDMTWKKLNVRKWSWKYYEMKCKLSVSLCHMFSVVKMWSFVYEKGPEGYTSKCQQQLYLSGRITGVFYFPLHVFLTFPRFLWWTFIICIMKESLNFFERICPSPTQWFNVSEMNAFQKMGETFFRLEDTVLSF